MHDKMSLVVAVISLFSPITVIHLLMDYILGITISRKYNFGKFDKILSILIYIPILRVFAFSGIALFGYIKGQEGKRSVVRTNFRVTMIPQLYIFLVTFTFIYNFTLLFLDNWISAIMQKNFDLGTFLPIITLALIQFLTTFVWTNFYSKGKVPILIGGFYFLPFFKIIPFVMMMKALLSMEKEEVLDSPDEYKRAKGIFLNAKEIFEDIQDGKLDDITRLQAMLRIQRFSPEEQQLYRKIFLSEECKDLSFLEKVQKFQEERYLI